VVVYLLRYVWRVLLFGASYQLAVELRENFYRQLSRQNPAFYLRHRTGDSGERYLDTYYNEEWVSNNIGDLTPYLAQLADL
jgi:hypothetical protein